MGQVLSHGLAFCNDPDLRVAWPANLSPSKAYTRAQSLSSLRLGASPVGRDHLETEAWAGLTLGSQQRWGAVCRSWVCQ